jgi:hypothetical protein
MTDRGNVSWAQFWRASSSLRVYGGNRTTRRLAARKDWPSYKKARQNGALIDEQAVAAYLEKGKPPSF